MKRTTNKENPIDKSFPSGNMIYKFDPEGHFTFVNPALINFLKLQEDEILGKHYSEVIRTDHRKRVVKFYEEQFAEKLPSTYFEFPLSINGVRDAWVGQTVEAIFDGSRIVEFVAVSVDITDRVLAIKSLRYTEERYRHIINNINLGTLEMDSHDVIVNANNAFCKLSGYTAEELIGSKAKSLISPGSYPELDKLNTVGQIAHDSPPVELMLLTKDYRLKWVMISGVSVKNKYDEKIGYLCVFFDTTEQKQQEIIRQKAEDALKESESQMRSILDSALDGLITIDEKGRVKEWNLRAEEIFGYEASETLGKDLSELIVPEKYRHAHNEGMKHFLSNGDGPMLNKRIEIHAKHKNGDYFPVELSIVPIKLNKHYIFSAFIRDITLKKKAEDDMNTALQRQKELAELKSRLISMTSHEYRTPLTTIKSSLDLLSFVLENQEIKNRDKVEKNINRINGEINRLNSLVNDILMIGKLESGNLPFNPAMVDLVDLVEGIVASHFQNENDGRQVELQVVGEPHFVSIDEGLYTHILTNLLSNAFKYSQGGANPQLALLFRDKVVEIRVKDNGIGIPYNEQDMLFDSFYRASNVKNIQGHGMGLAIVKQFLDMHRGKLSVTSELNRGTEFLIEQPYDSKD